MMNVAVLGTGHMGTAIARRLLANGCPVTVWNRTPAKAAALGEAGARLAATPAEAVARADLVITILTDAAAVEAALFGPSDSGGSVGGAGSGAVGRAGSGAVGAMPSGALGAMPSGAVLVQMSTIGPDEVRAVAARLAGSVPFLDAPVGGSVGAVEAGALTIFAGGPAAVVDVVEPVLRHLGTIRRCGSVGGGAALKLVVNTAMVTALGALHDTLAVADAVGVDRAVALEALVGGPLSGAIKRASATGASFAISLAAKDARLALDAVAALHAVAAVPVVVAAVQLLHDVADQSADVGALVDLEK